jgi:hypothetical protein
MFCKYCGKQINPSQFCKYCGRSLILPDKEAPLPISDQVEPSSPPPLPKSAWHYETNGERYGPVDTDTIARLIADGTLLRSHKVWRQGFQDWQPLEETEFGARFTGPPPLTKDSVNNGFVWIIALCPLINLIDPHLWWIAFAAMPLCWLDARMLRKAGHDTSRFGLLWALLVPAYLYRRAVALKQRKTYFAANLLAFCFVIFMTLNAGPDISQMEKTIQAGLTDQGTLGNCEKVTVLHKSGNEYTGLAEMSGGSTVSLEITVDGGKLIWRAK